MMTNQNKVNKYASTPKLPRNAMNINPPAAGPVKLRDDTSRRRGRVP